MQTLKNLSPEDIKNYLSKHQMELSKDLEEGKEINHILSKRAELFDLLLQLLWRDSMLAISDLALFAVGGYGRKELLPSSDIDILIYGSEEELTTHKNKIKTFLTRIWDFGVPVGHAVRTQIECQQLAQNDISVATSLIECRPIIAKHVQHESIVSIAFCNNLYSSYDFFHKKIEEQRIRHVRFDHADNHLEPDIKLAPGGLRDFHTIIWIYGRHYRTTRLEELVQKGIFSEFEFDILKKIDNFLKITRFHLHTLANRPQNRLLFEYQEAIAIKMGSKSSTTKNRIEDFMKKFYRFSIRLREFNDVLLQHFEETVLDKNKNKITKAINPRWLIHNNRLELASNEEFEKNPSCLLEPFVLLAKNKSLNGLKASTTRLIYQNRDLINFKFRTNITNINLFMELLRYPDRLPEVFQFMRLFGVLSRYIPEFGKIMGMMQHDLFHIFTVDAHTLQVIRNISRFYNSVSESRFPLATFLVKRISNIELLYLSAIFHDIAKGQKGDHSTMGGRIAYKFCTLHNLPAQHIHLVVWLVENHLLMSITAQKRDISDPETIFQFANLIGNQQRLDYLYCLTVADIAATNPELWTTWKSSLLTSLYQSTKDILKRGAEQLPGQEYYKREVCEDTKTLLPKSILQKTESFWKKLPNEYFIQHSSSELAWHAATLIDRTFPVVAISNPYKKSIIGTTQLLIACENRDELFTDLTFCLTNLGIPILEARLHTGKDNRVISIFTVQKNINGSPHISVSGLRESLLQTVKGIKDKKIRRKKTSRTYRHFAIPSKINFSEDLSGKYTIIEIIAPDRDGLLTIIGTFFTKQSIRLHTAKITTLGERVEDVFYVTDRFGKKIASQSRISILKNDLENDINKFIGASTHYGF